MNSPVVARTFQLLLALTALGALANESFGAIQAVLLSLLVLPLSAYLLTLAVLSGRWDSTGGIARRDKARDVALLSAVLSLPGAWLGWAGVALAVLGLVAGWAVLLSSVRRWANV